MRIPNITHKDRAPDELFSKGKELSWMILLSAQMVLDCAILSSKVAQCKLQKVISPHKGSIRTLLFLQCNLFNNLGSAVLLHHNS